MIVPAQVEDEIVESEGVEGGASGRLEPQVQTGFRALGRRDTECPERRRRRQIGGRFEPDRPQRHRMGGPVFARRLLVLAEQAAQRCAAGDADPIVQAALRQVRMDLHHAHGRNRRQVVRVNHVQERLGETRILRIHLELDPGRHVGESFKQPLDVGVRALEFLDEAFQTQAAGDLGEGARELAAHLGQVPQLPLVIVA